MAAFGVPFQRAVLAGTVLLMAVVFWSSSADPVNVPKATLAAVAAVAVAAAGAVRVAVQRRVTVPLAPALGSAAVLSIGLTVATVTSDAPWASWAGTFGRNDGLMLYASCLVLFAAGVRVLDQKSCRWLLCALLAGGAFAAAYGLLQRLHIDAIHWADVGISPVIGTFGNPDFESAYLGMVLPACGWGAITRSWSLVWRSVSGAVGVSALLVALLSSSVQGVLGGGAGLVVFVVALLLNREGPVARTGLAAVAALAGLVAVVVVAGVGVGVGPGARVVSAGSLTARKWYWGSAVRMWRQHPITGVGLDRYGAYFRSVRPAAAAAANSYSDAAHSVPLHLLATGGLVVALPYAVTVLLTGWGLVRGLRRLTGESRLLLGGLGGAWLAYQVQSLVSIDQPALAVTHWLLAGAVVALGSPPRLLERLLPGAPKSRVQKKPPVQKRRATAIPDRPATVWSPVTGALTAGVAVLALLAAWQVLGPLRASHDARSAKVVLFRGDGNAALDLFTAATSVAPYEQTFWLQRGQFLEQVKQQKLAAASYAEGVRHDARGYDVALAGAVLAKAQQDASTLTRFEQLLAQLDRSGRWKTSLGS